MAPVATLLPNIGSKCVGRNPLPIPARLRAFSMSAPQRGIDEAAPPLKASASGFVEVLTITTV